MQAPSPKASLRKWLLRIFVVSLLLALAAPVAIAVAIFHVSGDTRALRNAAIHGDGAQWQKQVEANVGFLPLSIARIILPFTPAPPEAQQAFSAIRSVEVSVHELRGSKPDHARILRDADEDMRKRGWDRVVAVLDHETVVAVYVTPDSGPEGKVKVSVLVVDGRQMVAVTGRANLQPVLDLAMNKAEEGFLNKHRRRELASATSNAQFGKPAESR
ncbi:MAG TPA: hypothetical protein VM680_14755 [Verrucomicrobiae bacterium]|nr:hypothetical protein [Verrucomicrobiae bacterium]